MNFFGKFPLVRLRQLKDNPGYAAHYFKRLFYYKYISHRFRYKYEGYTFLSPDETLRYLLDNKVSLARFSDGDIEQLTGAGEYPPDSDWRQKNSRALVKRLEQVLHSDDPRLLIAHESPEVFLKSRTEARKTGVVYNMWTDTRMILHKYLKKGVVYGHAHVFVPQHNPNFDWDRFNAFLSSKDVVIVTGGSNRLGDVSLGRRTFFVEAGKYHAFERYDEILKSIRDLLRAENLKSEETILMASLGPTADILAYDLTKEGYMVWDTGHFFRYANQQALRTGGRHVFTKQMHNRTPEEVAQSFVKAKRLYTASQAVEGLKLPEPLSQTKTTIIFERLNLPKLFSQALREEPWKQSDFLRIGCALGGLHKNQPQGSFEVHGDFCAHNIALDDNAVYFFDTEAPAIGEPKMGVDGSTHMEDVAAFCVSVLLIGSFKRPWTLLRNRTDFIKKFLAGYEEAEGIRVEHTSLVRTMREELVRLRHWQIAYGYQTVGAWLRYGMGLLVVLYQTRALKNHD